MCSRVLLCLAEIPPSNSYNLSITKQFTSPAGLHWGFCSSFSGCSPSSGSGSSVHVTAWGIGSGSNSGLAAGCWVGDMDVQTQVLVPGELAPQELQPGHRRSAEAFVTASRFLDCLACSAWTCSLTYHH